MVSQELTEYPVKERLHQQTMCFFFNNPLRTASVVLGAQVHGTKKAKGCVHTDGEPLRSKNSIAKVLAGKLVEQR